MVRQDARHPAAPTVLLLLDRSGSPTEMEERDLAASADAGPAIAERVDPEALGIDLPRFVVSGRLHELSRTSDDPAGGLVHELAPGEAAPVDYVDTHAQAHGRGSGGSGAAPGSAEHGWAHGRPDPDVAPPFGD